MVLPVGFELGDAGFEGFVLSGKFLDGFNQQRDDFAFVNPQVVRVRVVNEDGINFLELLSRKAVDDLFLGNV